MEAIRPYKKSKLKLKLLKKKHAKPKALTELTKSDPNYDLLFKNTSEGITIIQDEKFCFINSKMTKITGYTEEALFSESFTKFAHPEDRKTLLGWYRRCLRGEHTHIAYPFRFISNTGGTKWLLSTSIKIDWNGKPALILFITDITLKKKNEAPPDNSEMLFRALFDKSYIGALRLSLKGDLMYVNKSLAEIFEFDSAEAMVSSDIFKNDKNYKTLLRIIQSVENADNSTNFMIDASTKNNKPKRLYCHVSLHQDTVFGMITDVSNIAPIDKQFQNRTEALQTLFNASHDVSLLVDRNGIVQTFNKMAAEKLGKRPDELFDSKKSWLESKTKLESKLVNQSKDLKRKARQLEEANTALKVLLKKMNEDKKDLENRLMSSAKELILPYISKLKRKNSYEKREIYLNILEANINSIFTPYSKRLSAVYSLLTPSEIEVAELIRFGRSSKEIAEQLNVSVKTTETHRAKIRKKFGLTNKKINLRTYLLSF